MAEMKDMAEMDDVVAFFAPLPGRRPDRKLIAQCAEDVARYRRQRPPADAEEVAWLLEAENRPIADYVRWQMEIAVTDLDQMLIAQTALVVCMAYERALASGEGTSMDRPVSHPVSNPIPATLPASSEGSTSA
jgi:hypothetical protein